MWPTPQLTPHPHKKAAARPGEEDEGGRLGGTDQAGLPWGYGSRARDCAGQSSLSEIRSPTGSAAGSQAVST
ncbi:hypothetical protein GCM10010255_32650 [Streptomyces coeruleofuscus]|uniref:Uncharacterized protein n=1 Tax=Streptomyces coeruleofuscus TaxID=66879 RepID=A0ABN3I8U0_9ACTN